MATPRQVRRAVRLSGPTLKTVQHSQGNHIY